VPVEAAYRLRGRCSETAADLRRAGCRGAVVVRRVTPKAIGDLLGRHPGAPALSNNPRWRKPRLPVIGATKT